jgi:hypothetical protein
MHLPINVKSPNNISKWQMGFNSAFKGLIQKVIKASSFKDFKKISETCPVETHTETEWLP